MPTPDFRLSLGLALVLTLANVVKPVCVDDFAYIQYARQSAADPLRPYGFEILWWADFQPAMEVLAPPVVPAYLGLGIRLGLTEPWQWKPSLLPVLWLLTASALSLARRLCPERAGVAAALACLSPAVLPGVNLMLDAPALALGLTGLALFAARRPVAAGLLVSLALESKYSALVWLAVLPLAGWWLRSPRAAALAVAVALAGFAAVEAALWAAHGESHFLHHAAGGAGGAGGKPSLATALASQWGVLNGGLVLLGLAGRGAGGRTLAGVGAAIAAGMVAIVWVPDEWAVWTRSPDGAPRLTLPSAVAGALALTLTGLVGSAAARSFRTGDRAGQFLVLWWLAEAAAAVALSPFPAARRVMGLSVVTALVLTRDAGPRASGIGLRVALGFHLLLACAMQTLDALDARLEPAAARDAVALVEARRSPGERVWYGGVWGFGFECERLGMRAVDPGASLLAAGDWLVLPERRRGGGPPLDLGGAPLENVATVEHSIGWPASSIPSFYGGRLPFERRVGPGVRITVYRVRAPWRAANAEP